MGKLGWCITGHHDICRQKTLSGAVCSCTCHRNEQGTSKKAAQLLEEVDAEIGDLDRSAAGGIVLFGLDGVSYQIKLNENEASELRKSLRPYLKAARPIER